MSTSVSAVQSSGAAQATTPSNQLGKDDFLKLLVTQLQNQDPLNPLEGTEFVSQLAQFSSLEQLTNINGALEQNLQANQAMAQSIGNSLAATLVGKEVRATADGMHYDGSSSVSLGYTLSTAADTVNVKIYDQAGNLVRTIKGLNDDSGDNAFTWDGKNDVGKTVPAGSYTFTVEAKDAAGNAVPSSPYLTGKVTSIRFRADGTYFVIDGTEISIANVLEIMNG